MSLSRRRVLRAALLLVFLVLAGSFVLTRFAGIGEAWRVSARFPLWALGLALGLSGLRFVSDGRIVAVAARLGGARVSTVRGTEIFLAGSSAGLVFAGAALTIAAGYRWLRSLGAGIGAASLASWVPTTFDNLAMALAALGGLIHFFIHFRSSPPALAGSLSAIALLVAVAVAATWAVLARGRAAPWLAGIYASAMHRLRRPADEVQVRAEIERVLSAATELGGGRWITPLVWAVVAMLLDLLSLGVIFAAARHPIPAFALLTGLSVPELVGRVAPIPGGVGIVEAGMVTIYTAFGVPRPVAVAVVFAYCLVSFWLPSLVGFALVLLLERKAE
jgi:glycosyltransferase 2 family protein